MLRAVALIGLLVCAASALRVDELLGYNACISDPSTCTSMYALRAWLPRTRSSPPRARALRHPTPHFSLPLLAPLRADPPLGSAR